MVTDVSKVTEFSNVKLSLYVKCCNKAIDRLNESMEKFTKERERLAEEIEVLKPAYFEIKESGASQEEIEEARRKYFKPLKRFNSLKTQICNKIYRVRLVKKMLEAVEAELNLRREAGQKKIEELRAMRTRNDIENIRKKRERIREAETRHAHEFLMGAIEGPVQTLEPFEIDENCFCIEYVAEPCMEEVADHRRMLENMKVDLASLKEKYDEYFDLSRTASSPGERKRFMDLASGIMSMIKGKKRSIRDHHIHRYTNNQGVLVEKEWMPRNNPYHYSSQMMVIQLIEMQRYFEFNAKRSDFNPMLQKIFWTDRRTLMAVIKRPDTLLSYSEAELLPRACFHAFFDPDVTIITDLKKSGINGEQICPGGILLYDRSMTQMAYRIPQELYDKYWKKKNRITVVYDWLYTKEEGSDRSHKSLFEQETTIPFNP